MRCLVLDGVTVGEKSVVDCTVDKAASKLAGPQEPCRARGPSTPAPGRPDRFRRTDGGGEGRDPELGGAAAGRKSILWTTPSKYNWCGPAIVAAERTGFPIFVCVHACARPAPGGCSLPSIILETCKKC